MVIAEQKSQLECWKYVHDNGGSVWLKISTELIIIR